MKQCKAIDFLNILFILWSLQCSSVLSTQCIYTASTWYFYLTAKWFMVWIWIGWKLPCFPLPFLLCVPLIIQKHACERTDDFFSFTWSACPWDKPATCLGCIPPLCLEQLGWIRSLPWPWTGWIMYAKWMNVRMAVLLGYISLAHWLKRQQPYVFCLTCAHPNANSAFRVQKKRSYKDLFTFICTDCL